MLRTLHRLRGFTHVAFWSFLALIISAGCSAEATELTFTEPIQPPPTATSATPLPPGDWWQPGPETSWHWQLEGTLDLSHDVDVYDLDLFDTPTATIAELQSQGRRVVCYYSSGSWEEWRPDAALFAAEAIGDPLSGWPDERWLDVTHPTVRTAMAARLDLAVAKGCDGVEPDNIDGWDNDGGVEMTFEEQLAYNRWTAEEAHRRGLAVGLKNAIGQVPTLMQHYDFAVNEECWEWDECVELVPFIAAGKPVFHVEYDDAFLSEGCAWATSNRFQSLVLPLDLDGSFRQTC